MRKFLLRINERIGFILFGAILGIPFVSAADKSGGPLANVFKIIYDMFAFLPEKINFNGMDQQGYFYARFLLWILLFSILYFISSNFVFKEANQGVKVAVPLVIAIIGVVAIPGDLILKGFQTYSIVFAMMLWILPILGVWYLNHAVFKSEDPSARAPYVGRAFVYLILIIILVRMNESIGMMIANVSPTIKDWLSYLSILLLVAFFGFVHSLWKIARPNSSSYSSGFSEGSSSGRAFSGGGFFSGFGGGLKNVLKKRVSATTGAAKSMLRARRAEIKAFNELNELRKDITSKGLALDNSDVLKRYKKIESYIQELSKWEGKEIACEESLELIKKTPWLVNEVKKLKDIYKQIGVILTGLKYAITNKDHNETIKYIDYLKSFLQALAKAEDEAAKEII